MSNYTDASLIYYPSGYKAGKAYSLKPTDGSGDLTFTRASTATRVNESGLIESVATGVPRIDYTGGGCGKLLLEPQRTNLLPYSVGGGTGYSTFGTVTVTNNFGVSPDGTTTATRVNGSGVWRYRNENNTSLAPSTNYTFSVYVKSNTAGNQTFRLYLYNANFSADLVATPTWQRFTFNSTSSASVTQIHGLASDTSNNAADVQVWGWQMEQGSFPTSYIPTTSTAVTRVADSASKSGISSLIGQTEGVLYAEISTNNDTATKTITLSDGTSNNRIQLFYFNGVAIYGSCSSAGANQALIFTNIDVSNNIKVAFKYKVNDFALWVNGVKVAFDTTGAVPTNLNTLIFNNASGLSDFYGNVQNLMIFPSALSDTELATLTTI